MSNVIAVRVEIDPELPMQSDSVLEVIKSLTLYAENGGVVVIDPEGDHGWLLNRSHGSVVATIAYEII